MIYTFYSFKGGVGRSMALANIAELYYRRGLSVLMIDFDLEAPGLERFFQDAGLDQAAVLRSRGALDLLLSYKTLRGLPQLTDRPDQSARPNRTDSSLSMPRPFIVEPLQNFIVPIYRDTGNGAALSIMPAGRRDDDEYSSYAERIRGFDWEDFYVNWDGEQFFDWFAQELDSLAKVVLIDSRTGITEMSGVCTHQLADAVAQFVAPNQQNVDGVKKMARSLSREELITKGRKGRKLSQVIIPSRIEPGEGDKLDAFAELFEHELSGFIDKRLSFGKSAFAGLRIPYVPHYAYMETVAVREPDTAKSIDLVDAYGRIASALVELADPLSAFYSGYHRAKPELALESDSPLRLPEDHVDREWALDRIGAWLAAPAPAAMIVTGPPGSGKSTVLARVQQLSREASAMPGRRFPSVVFTFSCKGAPGEAKQFIADLARQLAARYPAYTNALVRSAGNGPVLVQRIGGSSGQETAVSFQALDLANSTAEAAFHVVIAAPLRQIYSADTDPILVIADGLEAASRDPGDSVVNVLATAMSGALPPHVRFLLATRQDPRVLRAIEGEVLDLGDSPASAPDDVTSYVEKRLESSALAPDDRSVIAQLVMARAEGNFFFARMVLDAALDGPRDPQAVRARVDALIGGNAPTNLRDYLRNALRQTIDYDSPNWREIYRPLLAALAVAKDALSMSQLAGIVGRSRSETADAIRTLRRFLAGEADGPFRIFHTAFTEFLIATDECGIDAGEAHQAVAKYFTDTYEDDWLQCDDVYALRYTIEHLTDAIRLAPDRGSRRPLEARLVGALSPAFVEAVLAYGLVLPLRDALRRAVDVVSAVRESQMGGALNAVEQRELKQWLTFLEAESATFANWNRTEQPGLFGERYSAYVGERVKEIKATAPPPPVATISSTREVAAGEGAFSNIFGPDPAAQKAAEVVRRQRAQRAGVVWLSGGLLVTMLTAYFATGQMTSRLMQQSLWFVSFVAAALAISTYMGGVRFSHLPGLDDGYPQVPDGAVMHLQSGHKSFRLLGLLDVASPAFETGALCYIACAAFLTFKLFVAPPVASPGTKQAYVPAPFTFHGLNALSTPVRASFSSGK